jgi:hypothetical protein
MLRSLRTLGVLGLCGLGLGSACTFKDPNEDKPNQGGSGGSESTAGKTNQGGKGGKGGTSSGGKAGRGNTPSGGEAGSGETGGAGGEGGAAPQCPGCESGFCLDDGTCVDCLPSNDHCPTGNYCTDANACEPGCKADGSTCASGVCASDHNCQSCINDDECLPGLVCSNGECMEPCTSDDAQGQSADCGSALLCCSTHCTDVLTDSQNCGACGTACGAGQFCGLEACSGGGTQCASCVDTALAGVCRIGKVIVILDTDKNESEGNRAPGRAIGAALNAQCGVAPVVTEAEQASVEALNLTTGQPVSGGGELLVVAGGPFFQNLEGYLEEKRIAPLYWFHDDEKSEYRRSANDEPVVSLPLASDHDSHDYFIIQFMHDAKSGSLALNAQGLWLSGTTASAFQLEHGILPNLADMTKAWYAYEWTDADGDKAPDLDEIVEVASGI